MLTYDFLLPVWGFLSCSCQFSDMSGFPSLRISSLLAYVIILSLYILFPFVSLIPLGFIALKVLNRKNYKDNLRIAG